MPLLIRFDTRCWSRIRNLIKAQPHNFWRLLDKTYADARWRSMQKKHDVCPFCSETTLPSGQSHGEGVHLHSLNHQSVHPAFLYPHRHQGQSWHWFRWFRKAGVSKLKQSHTTRWDFRPRTGPRKRLRKLQWQSMVRKKIHAYCETFGSVPAHGSFMRVHGCCMPVHACFSNSNFAKKGRGICSEESGFPKFRFGCFRNRSFVEIVAHHALRNTKYIRKSLPFRKNECAQCTQRSGGLLESQVMRYIQVRSFWYWYWRRPGEHGNDHKAAMMARSVRFNLYFTLGDMAWRLAQLKGVWTYVQEGTTKTYEGWWPLVTYSWNSLSFMCCAAQLWILISLCVILLIFVKWLCAQKWSFNKTSVYKWSFCIHINTYTVCIYIYIQ